LRAYRNVAMAYLLGVISMVGCASISYRYYTMSLPDDCYDKGTLWGKQGSGGWPDLPFLDCKPDSGNKGKCIAMMTSEFISQKKDLDECHVALDSCQHPPPSAEK
jgi:hypothetical protein